MSEHPRRRYPRYDVNWEIVVCTSSWQDITQLATTNISRGGVFVHSKSSPEIGSRIQTKLLAPDGEWLELHGTVVHRVDVDQATAQSRLPGFGIQFDTTHTMELTLLESKARASATAQTSFPISKEQVAIAAAISDTKGEQMAEILPLGPAHSSNAHPPVLPKHATERGDAVFGIDFGSSYCRIALVTSEGVELLKDSTGRSSMPSLCGCKGAGEHLVGWPARQLLAEQTEHGMCAISPKQLLGRKTDDPRVARALRCMPVTQVPTPGGEIVMEKGGQRHSLVDISANLLQELLAIGQRASGLNTRRAILTVPFGYSDRQRAALLAAAHIASLEVVEVVDEPVAAAVAHGLGRAEGALVGIYDLGGGGFNCALLEIRDHQCKTVAENGDPWLGGRAFDEELAEHAANFYSADVRSDLAAWSTLVARAEKVKIALSTSGDSCLNAPTANGQPLGPDLDISRALFADLVRPLVDRTIAIMAQCLDDAAVEPDELDALVLVGGMTHSPVVCKLVSRQLPCKLELSPMADEAVVVGSALIGRMQELRDQARKE